MKTLNSSSQRGLTLIELMIAMLIGVFLIAGIIQIFISSKQAYRLQENMARLQENGRFAMDFISKGVRMAGYTGCSSSAKNTRVMAKTDVSPVLTLTAISGRNNVTSDWIPTQPKVCGTTTDDCIAGTDVLNFMTSGSCGGTLTGNMQADNANIQIVAPNTCNLDAGEVVIISDCSSADVFAATTISGGVASGKETIAHAMNLNIDNKLSKAYQGDSEIFAPKLMSYYLRSGASGVPALWRFDSTDINSEPEELIEGIENMQVVYGVDTDTTQDYVPNYYVDASKVTDWSKVVNIRISLVAVSVENNLLDEPQPYTYLVEKNGTYNYESITPPKIYARPKDTSQICKPSSTTGCIQVNDLRLRRVFSSTIALRNRMP